MRRGYLETLALSPMPGISPDSNESAAATKTVITDLPIAICDRPLVLNGAVPNSRIAGNGTFTLHIPSSEAKVKLSDRATLTQSLPYQNTGEVAHLTFYQKPNEPIVVSRITSSMNILPAPDCDISGVEIALLDSFLAATDCQGLVVDVSPRVDFLDASLTERGFQKIAEAPKEGLHVEVGTWRRAAQTPDPVNPVTQYLLAA